MIARIQGTLESVHQHTALITPEETMGISYEVMVPAYLAQTLANQIGRQVTLYTLQYLESLNQGASFIPRLLGFAAIRDREFFELLTSVKGLGNKRAMRAMAMEPAAIARAIAERDARFLQSLPEIGPKLAELIVHELKTKVDSFVLSVHETAGLNAAAANAPIAAIEPKAPTKTKRTSADTARPAPAARVVPTPPIRQTVDALIALGESPIDAERMVSRALDRARSTGEPVPVTPEELLTAAYAAR